MKKIIAVSAGQNVSKKDADAIRNRMKYLNYGLLGLATILKHDCGQDVCMYQADNLTAAELIAVIEASGINVLTDCECFLLSIPSYYSISWCVDFCRIVKLRYDKKVIAGGRWVVDNRKDWVLEKLQYVDILVEGFGERKLANLFNNKVSVPDGSTKCFDWLDYRLLYEYDKYQPSVEISRGCGSGCQFCADKNFRRLQNKRVDLIERELDFLDAIYGKYSVYMEAPHFIFDGTWVDGFCKSLAGKHNMIHWRCTSRVETVPFHLLPKLADSGLKVLDVGLESASKRQLINMRKTDNPEKYLERAEELLIKCEENDIWVKFNLLLYAGETYSSIDETVQWLAEHKSFIKYVSVSSLVYYYNMDSLGELLASGASVPSWEDLDNNGYVDLNLSPEIDNKIAEKFSVSIPKLIVNQKDFYDVKSISYFENNYHYNDFLADLKKCDISRLPFHVDEI